jgi:hypothetical protein
MKNAVFWDVAPCGSCTSRRFGGTCDLHLQGITDWQSVNQLLMLLFAQECFLSRKWRQHVPPKRRLVQDAHGATSQKAAFFSLDLCNAVTYLWRTADKHYRKSHATFILREFTYYGFRMKFKQTAIVSLNSIVQIVSRLGILTVRQQNLILNTIPSNFRFKKKTPWPESASEL